MYKNIERKQRVIEAQDSSQTDSSCFDDDEKSIVPKAPENFKIFNSSFMESLIKSHKKNYKGMNLEGLVDSFVRHSVSHNNGSYSFMNESNYSAFSKTASKPVSNQQSAIDLLAKEHNKMQAQNKRLRNRPEDTEMSKKKKLSKKVEQPGKKTRPSPTPTTNKESTKPRSPSGSKGLSLKKSDDGEKPKRTMVNNYIEHKRKIGKLKVEIDLPMQDENQLKYSLITNSSDGQKIIYLKKKDGSALGSKDGSAERDEVFHKYAQEGEITFKATHCKKVPVKNARAYLTSSGPKSNKNEYLKSKVKPGSATGTLQRFSSASSKGTNDNILEIETLKSTSKDSRSKKVGVKKK